MRIVSKKWNGWADDVLLIFIQNQRYAVVEINPAKIFGYPVQRSLGGFYIFLQHLFEQHQVSPEC